MPHSIDKKYYARRADEQLEQGEQAASASIAAVHYEMALRYAILASDLPTANPEIAEICGEAGTLLPDDEPSESWRMPISSQIAQTDNGDGSQSRGSRTAVR